MVIARVPIGINWSYGTGSPGANIWHARWDGDLDGSPQLAGLLDDLQTFYDDISGLFTPAVTIHFDGEVTGLGGDTGETASYDPWTITGSAGSGSGLPTSNQIVVGWKTGSGGRSGRGRTFLGPLETGVSGADSLPVPGAITAVQDAADLLISEGLDAGNGSWGVFSRQDNVVRDFTSATVRREFGVLRSRRD